VLKVFYFLSLFDKINLNKIGTLLTNAMWMRQFVDNHPLYKHDSIVNDQIQYDLMWLMQRVSNGEQSIPLIRPSHLISHTKLYHYNS